MFKFNKVAHIFILIKKVKRNVIYPTIVLKISIKYKNSMFVFIFFLI